VEAETTALGAAYLAGLAVGLLGATRRGRGEWSLDREFTTLMPPPERARLYSRWQQASALAGLGEG